MQLFLHIYIYICVCSGKFCETFRKKKMFTYLTYSHFLHQNPVPHCHFKPSTFNEHLLHTVSLSCLDGNYLHLNPKINYIPINWQFNHWGNAHTRYNMIPCQKMDGTSSVCQTVLIRLLSLKVRLLTGCQHSSSPISWSLLVSGAFPGAAIWSHKDGWHRKTDSGTSAPWKQLHMCHPSSAEIFLLKWQLCDRCSRVT